MSSKKRTRSQVSNIPVVEPNNKMAKLISSYTAKDIKNDRLESKRKVFYHKKKTYIYEKSRPIFSKYFLIGLPEEVQSS